ncbi:MAG: glycosyltransferase [Candidatus Didemnitutus sp.]|nr:glycosyltransferase [Candidatus Didemnitutus sp.]
MKILHLANTAGQQSGGIGEVVHGLIKAQRQAEIDATLWFPGTPAMAAEVCAATGVEAKRVCAIPHVRIFNHVVPYGLLGRSTEVRSQYDLLHQHGIWVPNSIFVAGVAGRVKTIISPHGLLEPDRLQIARSKKRLIAHLYENRNLRRASCLVACSEQEAVGIRLYGLRQPIAVIPNGVADELLLPMAGKAQQAKAFKQQHGLPEVGRILLFLSRLHPLKGLDLLIDAAAELRRELTEQKWTIVIAGPSELGHREHLAAKIAALDLAALVRLLPALYGPEKAMAYQAADCFVLPSANENFGIVVIEALACGLPVLTTKQTPWQQLEERECGFWIERTVPALSAKLREIMQLSPSTLHAMGARGQALVTEQFLWSSVAAKLQELYAWTLGNGPCPDFVSFD